MEINWGDPILIILMMSQNALRKEQILKMNRWEEKIKITAAEIKITRNQRNPKVGSLNKLTRLIHIYPN